MFVTVFRQHNWHIRLEINSPLIFQKRITEEVSTENNEYAMEKESIGQETTGFLSENKGYTMDIAKSVPKPLTSDSVDAMYLRDFLSRPVNILNFTWAETDAIGTVNSIEPWYAFFNDTRIKNKLTNFAFLQCVLKVKVVINASPFYYGALLMNYQPLHNYTPTTIVAGAANENLILESQRPHIWIYPQGNQGGEMTLPYINYRNWTRTYLQQDFKDLGIIRFMNFTNLQAANGTSGIGVTISVFAWAEDVQICGASIGTALAQGGDEYKGIVSKPSSMIASIAGKLVELPIIGAFARATQIGAGAISAIAHMFGFTNVPNLKDVDPVIQKTFHNFADTSISYPIDKLTLDAKNELSISQQIAGLPDDEDPLIVQNFIKRESFLTEFDWSTTNAADDILFYMNVSPTVCNVASGTYPKIYSTPMSYVASMFEQWRGDIIIRVHIIASQFHKGRIRLIYDPLGDSTNNIVTNANSYTGCFNQIVDLGKNTNVEFRIPYCQATMFQKVQAFGTLDFQTGTTPTFNQDNTKHNGTFLIRCVTKLSAPIASSAVQIFISIRSESVEFANPSFYASTSRLYSLRAPQGALEYDDKGEDILAGGSSSADPNIYDIFFGEKVVSLRQILKRMNFVWAISQPNAVTWGWQYLKAGRFPPSYGFDNNGTYTVTGLISGVNQNYNWTSLCPLTWLTPCFIGQRGSINYALSSGAVNNLPRSEIFIRRRPDYDNANNSYGIVGNTSVSSEFAKQQNALTTNGIAGTTLSCGFTNQGCEFQMPYLSQYKFQTTATSIGTLRTSTDASLRDHWDLTIRSKAEQNGSQYSVFAGAGTDFNLIFFLNCPTVYNYGTVPTAV